MEPSMGQVSKWLNQAYAKYRHDYWTNTNTTLIQLCTNVIQMFCVYWDSLVFLNQIDQFTQIRIINHVAWHNNEGVIKKENQLGKKAMLYTNGSARCLSITCKDLGGGGGGYSGESVKWRHVSSCDACWPLPERWIREPKTNTHHA